MEAALLNLLLLTELKPHLLNGRSSPFPFTSPKNGQLEESLAISTKCEVNEILVVMNSQCLSNNAILMMPITMKYVYIETPDYCLKAY